MERVVRKTRQQFTVEDYSVYIIFERKWWKFKNASRVITTVSITREMRQARGTEERRKRKGKKGNEIWLNGGNRKGNRAFRGN